MTTYYRDGRMRVTSAEFWVDGIRYPLGELSYVWHRRGAADARAISRRTARWGLVLVAILLGLLSAMKTPTLIDLGRSLPDWWVRVLLVIAGSVAVTAIGWPLLSLVLRGMDHVHLHGVAVHEIWAQRRDQEILLLRTSDALLFGRVYRALERALEAQSD